MHAWPWLLGHLTYLSEGKTQTRIKNLVVSKKHIASMPEATAREANSFDRYCSYLGMYANYCSLYRYNHEAAVAVTEVTTE